MTWFVSALAELIKDFWAVARNPRAAGFAQSSAKPHAGHSHGEMYRPK